jgi:hypothetical protein
MQENPEVREAEVVKEGERQGKYLNPEFYGQPASAGMFYNENVENGGASPSQAPAPSSATQYETPTGAGQQQVVPTRTVEPTID